MISWLRRFATRFGGAATVPEDFGGRLATEERVLAVARSPEGPLVATQLGLWVPEGADARRVGWHLLNKVTWERDTLTVIEAVESGSAGAAVLVRDRPPRRLSLSAPSRLPDVVHERVTGSIRSTHHRSLPGGGARIVQRKVPGRGGIVVQARPDPGTDEALVAALAAEVAERVDELRKRGR